MAEEKNNEEEEKKNEGPEKWCGDIWHKDRLDSIGWAVFFIWGAMVMLAEATKFSENFAWWDGWVFSLQELGLL